MSYDIAFKVRVADTDKYVEIGDCDANITWNVAEIIRKSTGLPWENEENNGLCADIIPKIQSGIVELCTHTEKYKALEPDNGWGTVEGTIRFFRKIVSSWNDLIVDYPPEIVAQTTFWIQ